MKKLAGQTALVTGSDSGIGAAIAIEFAKEGADVVVVYHTDDAGAKEVKKKVETLGQKAIVLQCDVGKSADAEALFNESVKAFAEVSILVNNAGINGSHKHVAEMEIEEFERTLHTNLFGPFYLCRLFVKHRKEQGGKGKIVNVTSIHEEVVQPGTADYCASKGGLQNLTRALALEVAADGINVNNLAPGLVITPINQELIDDPELRKKKEQLIPMKRSGTTEEMAKLALFLASSDSDYVTGTTFTIDGGFSQQLAQGA